VVGLHKHGGTGVCWGLDVRHGEQRAGQERGDERGGFLGETVQGRAVLLPNTLSQWDLLLQGCRSQGWEVQCAGSPDRQKKKTKITFTTFFKRTNSYLNTFISMAI